jgi:hypothetical protein
MPRIYELPTHLQVEDVLLAGLTARQLVRLMIGSSLGYGVWDQVTWLPEEVRLALAVALAVIGVLFALLQPGGRSLDQWLVAGLLFVAVPRRLCWRPGATVHRHPSREQAGWAELELHPGWLAAEPDRQPTMTGPVARLPRAFWHFNRPGSDPPTDSQHQFTSTRWFR